MGRKAISYSANTSGILESVWLRYSVIMFHQTRLLFVPVLVVLVFVDLLCISGEVSRYIHHYDVTGNVPKYLQYSIVYWVAIPFTIYFVFLMIWSNSETAFPNIKYKLSTRALKTDHDHAYSHSIRQRTKYRYSAELKVRGTKMTIVDKVTGLVNGDLELEDVGVKLHDEMVKFKLDVNQITAVWISRDLIVMRFCWGMTYRSAWDVIVDRSKFVVGTDVDFIKFLKKNLKGKRITNNYLKFVNHPEKFRLGNYSTDTKTPFFTQRRVKIYHNFWGPFKKRGRKSKDKEIKK